MHNCGDGTTPSKLPFTSYYKRTLYGSEAPAWDAGTWIPDIVLITLANNDLDGSVKPTKEEFIAGYRAFIADMRTKWPGAGFICMAGNYDNQDTLTSIKRLYVQEV